MVKNFSLIKLQFQEQTLARRCEMVEQQATELQFVFHHYFVGSATLYSVNLVKTTKFVKLQVTF